jgi:LmbE family N-acetylglucosaminyl deacetylase
MNIMVIMAHPDDAEIWCGGTIIKHVEIGDPVLTCSLSYEKDSLRGKEALEGAKRMGCEVDFLGLTDKSIQDTNETALFISSAIENFQPNIIITHWFDDMHPDHEATFRNLRRALMCYYLLEVNDAEKVPTVFCCDTYNSQGIHGNFIPDHYVDVSSCWDKKVHAVNAHQSQPRSFYLDMIEKQCHDHGKIKKVNKAEGFLNVPLFGSLTGENHNDF